MATLGLLIYATLSVPYIGSFYPEFKTKQKEVTDNLGQHLGGLLEQVSGVFTQAPVQTAANPTPDPIPESEPVRVVEATQSPPLSELPVMPPPTQTAPLNLKPIVKEAEVKARIANVEPAPARGERIFYRWGAFSSTLSIDTQKLVEILSQYQAEKAGDLGLGEQYRGGSYFHFMIPNENFDALVEAIRNSGITQFTNSRATSDRLTPPGKRRIVFLVKPQ
jgi:hypothetical protein